MPIGSLFFLAVLLSAFSSPCAAQAAPAQLPQEVSTGEYQVSAGDSDAGVERARSTPVTDLTHATSPHAGNEKRAELEAVDLRLRALRQERPGVGGPIALMVVGGTATVACAYFAFYAWFVSEVTYVLLGSSDRTGLIALSAGTLAGIGMLAGGAVWLGRHVHQRRTYAPELSRLRQQRRRLLEDLQLGPSASSHQFGMALSARF